MPVPTLPALALATSVPSNTDVLVVGCAALRGAETLVGLPSDLTKAYAKAFGSPLTLALELGASTTAGTTALLPTVAGGPRVLVVGLGNVDVTPEQVRRSVGSALRAVTGLSGRELRVAVSLDAVEPEIVQAAAEGALLGSYTYGKVTSTPKPAVVSSITVLAASVRGPAAEAIEVARVVAAAVCTAREWVNVPANLLYPESFAAEAKAYFRDVRVGVDVRDDKQLDKEGFGGILAVGGGSARKPRLVRVDYAPRGAKLQLVLVGKGITFDSGGLNLKPADGMYTMKCDMAGAAAVLSATKAIAQLGLKVKVVTYAALAENMPSDAAYRPSDVLTMYGGTTVENANSDAEGRLVMADAIARANADAPDLVIDVATLTGACMVALGVRTAGLFASDDETADRILDAAEVAGESFWQLPIPDEARAELDSAVADRRSSGKSRMGGALVAAAFLQSFVAGETPWAHLDIAGPAFNSEAAFHYVPAGGTGFAVRTIVTLAQSLQG